MSEQSEKEANMVQQIQITYIPQKKDYVHASRILALKSPTFLIMAGIILVVMLASVVILLVPSLSEGDWHRIATVVLLVSVFFILYYFFFIPYQLSRAYKGNLYLRVERQITLSEKKLLMKIGERLIELDWEHALKVVDGKELYMIIYRDRNQAYPLLPKRAFGDAAQEEAFLALMKEKSIKVV
jgi:hypothetical protein